MDACLWREREGVEPTIPVDAPGPTILKTAGPTRTHPLPSIYFAAEIRARTRAAWISFLRGICFGAQPISGSGPFRLMP